MILVRSAASGRQFANYLRSTRGPAGRNVYAALFGIETKYERRRRERALGKLTQVELELIYPAADAV